jgi:hypothetical protein
LVVIDAHDHAATGAGPGGDLSTDPDGCGAKEGGAGEESDGDGARSGLDRSNHVPLTRVAQRTFPICQAFLRFVVEPGRRARPDIRAAPKWRA